MNTHAAGVIMDGRHEAGHDDMGNFESKTLQPANIFRSDVCTAQGRTRML